MKWKNANREELPPNDEQVLISANGVYYIATYNETRGAFVVHGERSGPREFEVKEHQIYWTDFDSE